MTDSDHIVIAGGGRVGFRVSQFFEHRGHAVTVVEQDPDRAAEHRSEGVELVVGNAT